LNKFKRTNLLWIEILEFFLFNPYKQLPLNIAYPVILIHSSPIMFLETCSNALYSPMHGELATDVLDRFCIGFTVPVGHIILVVARQIS